MLTLGAAGPARPARKKRGGPDGSQREQARSERAGTVASSPSDSASSRLWGMGWRSRTGSPLRSAALRSARPVVHGFDLASMNQDHHREFKLKLGKVQAMAISGQTSQALAEASQAERALTLRLDVMKEVIKDLTEQLVKGELSFKQT